MKRLALFVAFLSFGSFAEDSNYDKRSLKEFAGTFEVTEKGVKYLLDIEETSRGKLKITWRNIPPFKVKRRTIPKEFSYSTFDFRGKVSVRNSREHKVSWQFRSWERTRSGKIKYGPVFTRYATGRDSVTISWHNRSENIIKLSVSLATEGVRSEYGAGVVMKYGGRGYYLKRVAN